MSLFNPEKLSKQAVAEMLAVTVHFLQETTAATAGLEPFVRQDEAQQPRPVLHGPAVQTAIQQGIANAQEAYAAPTDQQEPTVERWTPPAASAVGQPQAFPPLRPQPQSAPAPASETMEQAALRAANEQALPIEEAIKRYQDEAAA